MSRLNEQSKTALKDFGLWMQRETGCKIQPTSRRYTNAKELLAALRAECDGVDDYWSEYNRERYSPEEHKPNKQCDAEFAETLRGFIQQYGNRGKGPFCESAMEYFEQPNYHYDDCYNEFPKKPRGQRTKPDEIQAIFAPGTDPYKRLCLPSSHVHQKVRNWHTKMEGIAKKHAREPSRQQPVSREKWLQDYLEKRLQAETKKKTTSREQSTSHVNPTLLSGSQSKRDPKPIRESKYEEDKPHEFWKSFGFTQEESENPYAGTEFKQKIAPVGEKRRSRRKSRTGRPSPEVSAGDFPLGYEMQAKDGRTWVIVQAFNRKTPYQRWQLKK